jgi:hypothetical protein
MGREHSSGAAREPNRTIGQLARSSTHDHGGPSVEAGLSVAVSIARDHVGERTGQRRQAVGARPALASRICGQPAEDPADLF